MIKSQRFGQIAVVISAGVICVLFFMFGCKAKRTAQPQVEERPAGALEEKEPVEKIPEKETGPVKVVLHTNFGDIVIKLREDMPITAGNFEKLVREGFYDGVIFHRVIPNFMIQGGDPTGTGRGGPGYTIKDEFTGYNRNDRGTIAMANAGPNTGGSQFFINLVYNRHLDGKHPVFGTVIEGMDVVDKIAGVETGAGNRPVKEVKIIKAEVVE